MLPKWFTPVIVAVVAGSSLWLLSNQAPREARSISSGRSVPDAFMDNFTTLNLDKNGTPKHKLKASHMVHYPDGDYSEFTLPELILYRPEKQQWTVSAETGKTTKDIKDILLRGEVNIQRINKATGISDITIKTQDVLIRPDDTYIETDHEIDIRKGKSRIQSTGIRANLDKGQVELLSRVKGVYEL